MEASQWVGKVGALKTRKEKDQYGGDRTGVHYFLSKKQAMNLPAWQGTWRCRYKAKVINTTIN